MPAPLLCTHQPPFRVQGRSSELTQQAPALSLPQLGGNGGGGLFGLITVSNRAYNQIIVPLLSIIGDEKLRAELRGGGARLPQGQPPFTLLKNWWHSCDAIHRNIIKSDKSFVAVTLFAGNPDPGSLPFRVLFLFSRVVRHRLRVYCGA